MNDHSEGHAIELRSRGKLYDEKGVVRVEQLLQRLDESMNALLYHLSVVQHQKSVVLKAYSFLDQSQIPESLQRRIEFLFRLSDSEQNNQ